MSYREDENRIPARTQRRRKGRLELGDRQTRQSESQAQAHKQDGVNRETGKAKTAFRGRPMEAHMRCRAGTTRVEVDAGVHHRRAREKTGETRRWCGLAGWH